MSKKTVLSRAELEAEALNNAREIYLKKIEQLCQAQSKIILQKSLLETVEEISNNSDDPCMICSHSDSEICAAVAAGCFDELDIDHCFEGVLNYLTENMDLATEDAEDTFEHSMAIDPNDVEIIKEIRAFVEANLETVHAFADLAIKATKNNYPMLPEQTKYIVSLLGTIKDVTGLICDTLGIQPQDKAVKPKKREAGL